MLLHKENLNRKTILDFLRKTKCKVIFTKVKDNTTRSITCTLSPNDLPQRYNESVDKVFAEEPYDPDIIPIWDLTEGAWKSFRISKIVSFHVLDDELTESEGHIQKSKQQKAMEEKKKQAKEKFADRVKKSKQTGVDDEKRS